MREVQVARAIILNDKKEIFLCQRAQDPGKGKMEMPGGKVDPGESAVQASVREVREEVGLIFTPKKLFSKHQDIDEKRNIVWVNNYFYGTAEGNLTLDPVEVASSGHYSKDQIRENNFEMAFDQKDHLMAFYEWYEHEANGLTLPRSHS